MSTTENTEELLGYLRGRVECECNRMEHGAMREALEPLMERFSIQALARVAAEMAQQPAAKQTQAA